MAIPQLKLNDGNIIPQFGLGTWQVPNEDAERVVLEAFEMGYRHIDTAELYMNEEAVGKAVRSSGLPREEIWVTTKLWNNHRGKREVEAQFEKSLKLLGLDYIDLYLIHWPAPNNGPIEETWETFASLRDRGLVRSIGVSNFDERFLPAILNTGIIPAVDQIELNPQFQQRATVDVASEYDVKIEAWGPLGRGKIDFDSGVIGNIAQQIGATWAQVVLAWHIARGHIVFPKSVHKARVAENLAATELVLSDAQLQQIDALDLGEAGRLSGDPALVN